MNAKNVNEKKFNPIVYPGSFDPFTLGHLDLAKRASKIFSEVHILVTSSIEKKYLFTIEERVEIIKKSIKGLSAMKVESYQGLTIDYAKEKKISCLLRGIRSHENLSFERDMAFHNQKMYPDLEIFFLFPKPEYEFIQSRFVKEIAFHGGDLKAFVHNHVEILIKEKMK